MRGFMIFEAREAKSGSETPLPECFMLLIIFSKPNQPPAGTEKEKLGETQALHSTFWGSEIRIPPELFTTETGRVGCCGPAWTKVS